MKFRLIQTKTKLKERNKYLKQSDQAVGTPTKREIGGSIIQKIGQGLSKMATSASASIGTDAVVGNLAGDAITGIGKAIGTEPKEIENAKKNMQNNTSDNMRQFLDFIAARQADGSHSEIALTINDKKRYPEIYYIKAYLPHADENQNILPIVKIETSGIYDISLIASKPGNHLYRSLIKPSYMLLTPPASENVNAPPAGKGGADSESAAEEKVEADLRNNLKSEYGTGLEITSYLIAKMQEYGLNIEYNNEVALELQEYFYSIIHRYLQGNYQEVYAGAESSFHNIIIKGLLDNIAKFGNAEGG